MAEAAKESTKKKFDVVKDPFATSPKNLSDLIHKDTDKWISLAKEYFKEDPNDLISDKVPALKAKMMELGLELPRDDVAYVLKFLLAGGGDVETALEVVKNYIKIMKDSPTYFEHIHPSALDEVFKAQVQTMMQSRDESGRRVYVYRPGRWNPSTTSFADIFAAGFVFAEMVSEEIKTQIGGVTVVADAEGFGFKQLRNFGLTDARTMSSFLQVLV
jgi:hypothetical protein